VVTVDSKKVESYAITPSTDITMRQPIIIIIIIIIISNDISTINRNNRIAATPCSLGT
jgi:hypothetical protein